VEGASDRTVLELLAGRLGRDLGSEGIEIVPIGGAQAIRRFVAGLPTDTRVRGLCDENEAYLFRRVLDDVHVCRPDLEGELIRALGIERVLEIVDRSAFAKMQQQPAQRGLRSSSVRFHRYLPRLAAALDLDAIPAPLRDVLWS
jgi:hypothetical protein